MNIIMETVHWSNGKTEVLCTHARSDDMPVYQVLTDVETGESEEWEL